MIDTKETMDTNKEPMQSSHESPSVTQREPEAQHVEVAGLSPAAAARLEKRVVLKQDLTVVLLLAGAAFFAYLVSPQSLADTKTNT